MVLLQWFEWHMPALFYHLQPPAMYYRYVISDMRAKKSGKYKFDTKRRLNSAVASFRSFPTPKVRANGAQKASGDR
jgi:hypothetical protein